MKKNRNDIVIESKQKSKKIREESSYNVNDHLSCSYWCTNDTHTCMSTNTLISTHRIANQCIWPAPTRNLNVVARRAGFVIDLDAKGLISPHSLSTQKQDLHTLDSYPLISSRLVSSHLVMGKKQKSCKHIMGPSKKRIHHAHIRSR